jgi:large subunit ribosomal protein L35
MAKLRTHKATAKRFRKTGRGKWMRRSAGQDHFNARESGRTTKRKRRDLGLHEADRRNVERLLPHAR